MPLPDKPVVFAPGDAGQMEAMYERLGRHLLDISSEYEHEEYPGDRRSFANASVDTNHMLWKLCRHVNGRVKHKVGGVDPLGVSIPAWDCPGLSPDALEIELSQPPYPIH